MLHCFEGIFDICDADYVPKPTASCYEHFCRVHGVDAKVAAMFEDIPHNLEAPHVLGMTTVLVHSSYVDHPVQAQMKTWEALPDHIHHMTLDLTDFLAAKIRDRG